MTQNAPDDYKKMQNVQNYVNLLEILKSENQKTPSRIQKDTERKSRKWKR